MVLLLGFMSLCVAPGLAAEQDWTRSKILALADAEAQRLGYDIEQMSVSFDVYKSNGRDYLGAATNFETLPNVQAQWRDRDYVKKGDSVVDAQQTDSVLKNRGKRKADGTSDRRKTNS